MKHMARSRKPVEKQESGSVLRAGLPIEDIESIEVDFLETALDHRRPSGFSRNIQSCGNAESLRETSWRSNAPPTPLVSRSMASKIAKLQGGRLAFACYHFGILADVRGCRCRSEMVLAWMLLVPGTICSEYGSARI